MKRGGFGSDLKVPRASKCHGIIVSISSHASLVSFSSRSATGDPSVSRETSPCAWCPALHAKHLPGAWRQVFHVKHLRVPGIFGRGLEHSSAPSCPPAPSAALLAPLHRHLATSAFIDPSPEPAWSNESIPWRAVPACPSLRQRWRTCPPLVGACPDASVPFTRSCSTSRDTNRCDSVATTLVVAAAVAVASS